MELPVMVDPYSINVREDCICIIREGDQFSNEFVCRVLGVGCGVAAGKLFSVELFEELAKDKSREDTA
eukprot:14363787-Ditylum_brightwellii.AAC.1